LQATWVLKEERVPFGRNIRVPFGRNITPEGRSLVTGVNKIDQGLRHQLRRRISREERQQLAAVVLRVQANLATIVPPDI
jgi:hypothetical protein